MGKKRTKKKAVKKKARKKTKKVVAVLRIPEVGESDFLMAIEQSLPQKDQIKNLTGKKLVTLRKEVLDKLYEGDEHYYSISQFKKTPKIKALFSTFNTQVISACLKPNFLKKQAQAHQKVFTWYVEDNGIIDLSLSEKLTIAGVQYVLKKSKDNVFLDNVITWNTSGKPTMIHISDTDTDIFFDYVGPKIKKNRASGGPSLSATAVAEGTEIIAPNGSSYTAESFGKTQRWVKNS